MVDVFDAKKRSEVMSRIRGTGNLSTEVALIELMCSAGITGWENHVKIRIQNLQSQSQTSVTTSHFVVKPDFIFGDLQLAVFVDGCFWHLCPLHSRLPANNREFWEAKLYGNVARDRQSTKMLRQAGWSVLRFWEHDMKDRDATIRRLRRCLTNARRRKLTICPN